MFKEFSAYPVLAHFVKGAYRPQIMDYEDMDDAVEQSSLATIPVALAVLGIVLGIVGLYFGFTAKQDLNVMSASMQESTAGAAQVKKALASFDSQIVGLEKQVQDQANLINRLRVYSNQREKDLKKLALELNKNRGQIETNAQQMEALKNSAVTKPSAKQAASSQTDKGSESATTAGGEQIYTILSGDTFSKIAAKFGVSVESIIDVNPYADPRRLRVGQEIVIPAK